MDKKNNNINTIYDDSVSSGAILKDAKKKLGKRINIDIDNISVEEKANTVINNLDRESKTVDANNKIIKKTRKIESKVKKVVSPRNSNQDKKVVKVTNKNKQVAVKNIKTARKNSIFENE